MRSVIGAQQQPGRARPLRSLLTHLSALMLLAMVPLALLLAYQVFNTLQKQRERLQQDLQRTAALLAAAAEHVAGTTEEAREWQSLLAHGAPAGSIVSLVDAAGRPLAGTPPPPSPQSHFSAWQTLPKNGWRLGVSVPAEPLEQQQQRALLAALATVGACLLLGLSLATLLARRITEPLRELATRGPEALSRPPLVQEIALLREALAAAQQRQQQSQTGLQRQAAEFQTLFESTPIGLAFWRAGEDEGQRLHNPAMDLLLGPVAEAAAMPMWLDGHTLAPEQQPLQQAAREGRAIGPLELELRGPDRRLRHVLMQAVPLLDAEGRVEGALASAVDISERKKAEQRVLQADRRLRDSQHLIDLAQEAGEIGFFRVDTHSATWTPAQARLLGLPGETATSLPADERLDDLLQRIHPEDRDEVESGLRAMVAARREREALDFRVLLPDGGTRWLHSRVQMSYSDSGRPLQLVGATLNVSEQKALELERERLAALEQLARIEAENINRAKDEFLAMLGHELRNPLAAISSSAEVLNRLAGEPHADAELAGQARAIIVRQTRHLARLVDDLLDVGRVISGKVLLRRQRVELAALLRRVLENFEVGGGTAHHDLQSTLEPVWVDADATRLEQVASNLIGNALKYTPEGRRIAITLRGDEAGQALLEVRDEGDGIAPALLPHVFDLFVQGERRLDRRAGGLGIGLTLVRRLVELHGGSVEAESSPAGSVFRVHLPRVAPPPASAEAPRWRGARMQRVLLVEDNADALASLRAMLELDGHRVHTASDGHVGLSLLLDERPDLAIVDIGLPGLSGYELARQSRRAGYSGQLLALSGYGAEVDRIEALRHGFDEHLAKPIDAQRLRDWLAKSTQ
ncbi:hybrid sensor histidine kinase/response regulator [Roseateles violae]|uniref:histidine kinase n=1 Tax=Roseateles violae TaxID=3058042 RepID=A0ABT8DQN8_9BURK|nr:ATP-binding protein [Pelomonas sp. PFR6]MDN3920664.1 ATP-binding protein [Pelomonas sp. PFR6]